jgi:hypothetical protein
MAKHVVKNIGLLQVVQLVRFAQKVARWKTAVSQVVKKHFVWHQAWHRYHLPAGVALQRIRQALKVWNAVCGNGQLAHALHKGIAR